ncbi:uncharacterized protein LOC122248575 [Penaeus japonicus]|uniref:uncharacterized protein LOC122248575 n=1 Tax=Penaeus japonicus TaxID=27405 RepID=UPI001C70DFE8|nr:uncharacterized protein LOC122248575 [Penaeus japonicus]
MKKCCWCCISLQKGVVAIGVLSMIASTLLTVGYGVVSATLEEHVLACRSGEPKDLLGLLPTCDALGDASTLLTARIFVYVQVAVWLLFLVFSVLLIVGAVKERSGLLVPWMVLSVVVMAAVVWAGVRAALHQHTLDLLASILALAVCAYFCLVVRSYSKLVKKQGLVPVLVPSTFHAHQRRPCECCCEEEVMSTPTLGSNAQTRHPSRLSGSQQGRDQPPAYSPRPPTPTKKGPPPTGLGFKI